MTKYLVIYEMDDSGAWGASSPDLPGCVAVGATQAEVERLIDEAIPLHLDAMRAVGEPIPEPRHRAGSVSA
jgi:predicted RNase H-like HicB family nuclease